MTLFVCSNTSVSKRRRVSRTTARPVKPSGNTLGPLTLTLTTTPPSVNNANTNARGFGRVPTARTKAWREQAGWELLGQKRRFIDGEVRVHMRIEEKLMKLDPDNSWKLILDLLVEHGIISDDGPKVVKSLYYDADQSIKGIVIHITPRHLT